MRSVVSLEMVCYPQLSYRGRILICNNLVASSLWHKMMVLEPPEDLVRGIQQRMVDFFWSGQHWLKASVLYLPLQEGGQGLVDNQIQSQSFSTSNGTETLIWGGCKLGWGSLCPSEESGQHGI